MGRFSRSLLPCLAALVLGLGAAAACAADALGPLDLSLEERLDAQVDTRVAYRVVATGVVPVVPSAALPGGLDLQPANNNLSIALHDGRLFLAFRTAPTHFASDQAKLLVLSSPDLGRTWSLETTFATGRDLREPFLLEVAGRLHLYYAELGTRAVAFEPRALWRSSRCGPRCWTAPERWGGPDEIAWDFKVRRGRAWVTSYRGKHYGLDPRPIELRFRSSTDGILWQDVGGGPVYSGGATESSFEFERGGALWAVTRNEDGDATGFGSHVVSADASEPGAWRFPAASDPSRFDSPRLFRHGNDIYLLARRDLGDPAGTRFTAAHGQLRKLLVWAGYSLEPKRTALFRLDPRRRRFDLVFDLPSAADTAFPSLVRLSPHEFLVANYTSAFRHSDWSWFRGQVNGTGIYFLRLRFDPLGPDKPSRPRADLPAGDAARAVAVASAGGFDEDWPVRESHPRRLAGAGVLSVGAIVLVHRRRRRLRSPDTSSGSRPESPRASA